MSTDRPASSTEVSIDAGAPPPLYRPRPKVEIYVSGREKPYTLFLRANLNRLEPAEDKVWQLTKKEELHVRFVVDNDLCGAGEALSEVVRKRLMDTTFGKRVSKEEEEVKWFTSDDDAGTVYQRKVEMREFLKVIAKQGYDLYKMLFGVNSIDARDDQKKIYIDAVRSVLERVRLVTVSAEHPLFPWGFLYNAEVNTNDLTTVDWQHFWGFRYEIQVQVPNLSSATALSGRCRIGAAVCPTVDTKSWHDDASHPFHRKDKVVVKSYKSYLDIEQALRGFDQDCFYFFGHAGIEANHDPWIKYDSAQIWLASMSSGYDEKQIQFLRDPVIVFLNGCSTAPVSDFEHDSPLGLLIRDGDHRVCGVGTVGAVPGPFAAALARLFWNAFLEGDPLGTALLTARRELAEKCENPLGLLYTTFGDIDTCLRASP
jgi:hypothetical protein